MNNFSCNINYDPINLLEVFCHTFPCFASHDACMSIYTYCLDPVGKAEVLNKQNCPPGSF